MASRVVEGPAKPPRVSITGFISKPPETGSLADGLRIPDPLHFLGSAGHRTYRAPDAYLPHTSPAPIEWIPSRSADGPLAQTPLSRWPQAEAGTETAARQISRRDRSPVVGETTGLAAEHLGTPDETQCSGFPGSPRGAPGGGKKEEKDEAAYRAPDAYLPHTSPAPNE